MTLNCNGQLIDLNTPKLMGILNVTPDSFYDGGRFKDEKSVLTQKDIGYHRTTKLANEDIMRIYFTKNTKLTIAADGQTYDNTPQEILFGT